MTTWCGLGSILGTWVLPMDGSLDQSEEVKMVLEDIQFIFAKEFMFI
jgi:hypothetical protein